MQGCCSVFRDSVCFGLGVIKLARKMHTPDFDVWDVIRLP